MYLPMGLIVLLAILFLSMVLVIINFTKNINRLERNNVRNYYRVNNLIADTGCNFYDIYGNESEEYKHIIRLARKIECVTRAHMEDYELSMQDVKEIK